MYDSEFFSAIESGSEQSARAVLGLTFERVVPRSVIDVGCGVGTWAAVAKEMGVTRVLGVDGPYVPAGKLRLMREEFLAHDLTQPLRQDERFDLAICMEVAEHLPAKRSEGLVADLCSLADTVLFSAAIPGQGGLSHVNERPQSFWAHLFEAHGLRPLDLIRPRLWNDESVEWWYRQNTLLYVRDAGAGRVAMLDLVHPDLLAHHRELAPEEIGVRALLSLVRPAIAASVSHRLKAR